MKKDPAGYLPFIHEHMLTLPGVTEGVCFGTAAFYVSKKLLARIKEDGQTLAVYTPDRDEWTVRDNIVFFITDHYKNYPYVLVNLGKVKKADLVAILTEAWRSRAGKRLLQQAGLS
jgi:hypothetical protein